MAMDFGFNKGGSGSDTTPVSDASAEDKTNIATGATENDGVEDINNPDNPDNVDNNKSTDNTDVNNDDNKGSDSDKSSPYEPGTTLDVDGITYTINENNEVVDAEGNVFKKSDEVEDWLKSFDEDDSDDASSALTLERIQKEFGVEIVDDNDEPVVFENTPDGVNSYIKSVVEVTKESIAEETINAFYDKFPFLETAIPYYVANGNTLEGYGQHQDRSSIELSQDDVAQQESIIRMAFKEQGKKGDVDNYIHYLKSNDTLYDVAEEELKGLKELDNERNEAIEQQALQKELADIENDKKFWSGVKSTIDNRVIGGYKIPETIVMSKDGKQVAASPTDFYNYVSKVDSQGKTAYQRDMDNKTTQQAIDDELIAAFITFNGGSYSSLVNMAVNEEKVQAIRLKSKTQKKSTVKINPAPKGNKPKDIDLGGGW